MPFTLFEVFGFGKPPEASCLMERPGVQSSAWAPSVRMVADHLGAPLERIRETYEKRVTDRRLEVAAGVIEAGTVAAVRFETIGVVDGRDAIVIEHVNRMAPDVAPDWPTASRDGTYRIRLEGEPTLALRADARGAAGFRAAGDGRDGHAGRERDSVRRRGGSGARELDGASAADSAVAVRAPCVA